MAGTDGPTAAPSPVRRVTVGEDDSGQRLDNFLLRQTDGVPRTRLYRALRKGEVRVNKGRVRADYRLCAGDVVRIPPLRERSRSAADEPPAYLEAELEARIVHEDDVLLAINKPAGLAVHGGSGLRFGLIESLRKLRPRARYLELVHRLDRDTSGLLLIAKRASTLRELHRQLREKHMRKHYLALGVGRWPRAQTLIDAPLQKNVLQSGERMVRVSKAGRKAMTEFAVLERLPGATFLKASPVTGRTHQIRVHARHGGCALLGDVKYATDESEALTRDLGLKRLFLHASELQFTLPDQGAYNLHATLDEELENTLIKLRKRLKNKS